MSKNLLNSTYFSFQNDVATPMMTVPSIEAVRDENDGRLKKPYEIFLEQQVANAQKPSGKKRDGKLVEDLVDIVTLTQVQAMYLQDAMNLELTRERSALNTKLYKIVESMVEKRENPSTSETIDFATKMLQAAGILKPKKFGEITAESYRDKALSEALDILKNGVITSEVVGTLIQAALKDRDTNNKHVPQEQKEFSEKFLQEIEKIWKEQNPQQDKAATAVYALPNGFSVTGLVTSGSNKTHSH